MWLTDKASEVTSERLTSLYAYPPGGAYVRANMVASIDGAAGLEGRSGGLGGPGDRKIFSLLRAWAEDAYNEPWSKLRLPTIQMIRACWSPRSRAPTMRQTSQAK